MGVKLPASRFDPGSPAILPPQWPGFLRLGHRYAVSVWIWSCCRIQLVGTAILPPILTLGMSPFLTAA